MNNISTLYQLVQASGCDYCVFDTGRRICEINKSQFQQFETGEIAYPYPIQKTAKFALVYWPIGHVDNPFIWFMNLPLDEESQLINASRNHFIAIIQEAMGNRIAEQAEQQKLPDNPYIKVPDAKKLAVVNAQLKRKLNLINPANFSDCIAYLETKAWSNWRSLTIQSWADFITQIDDPKLAHLFESAFFNFPAEMQAELASLLEHQQLSRALNRKLLKKLANEDINDAQAITWLRCISASSELNEFNQWLFNLLSQNKAITPNVLAVITARCWMALTDPLLLTVFLEYLAKQNQTGLFDALFTDLIAIPNLRRRIFALLQNPAALTETRKAIHMMMVTRETSATH